jgi:hypothetical protein
MGKTLERIVEMTARHTAQMSPGAICRACRDDSKCSICGFNANETVTIGRKAKELMAQSAKPQ